MNTAKHTKISVVIPCYYSEKTIAKVVCGTREHLLNAGYDYEFVCVNDGSKDNTYLEIEMLASQDANIVGVELLRNFGQHNAIMAGLARVSGDLVLLMDDDMQTHPSQCIKIIEALDNETDVVFGAFSEVCQNWFRRAGSKFAMATVRVFAGCPKDITDSNFLVMRRCVSDEILKFPGKSVYIQGLIFRTTDRLKDVSVQHFNREEGESGYSFKSLLALWFRIFSFSVTPIRAVSAMGMLMSLAGLIWAIALIIDRITSPDMELGWASVMVTILACSGILMFSLGIVGEYVGRLFTITDNTPQYIVRKTTYFKGKAQ